MEALKAIYNGDDVFLSNYMLSSNSFLYDQKLKRTTLPSLRRSVCIIISPLISLMVDQVAQLRSPGVVCSILSGSSGVAKPLLASVKDVKLDGFSLLFAAPEAVVHGDHWRNMLSEEYYTVELSL